MQLFPLDTDLLEKQRNRNTTNIFCIDLANLPNIFAYASRSFSRVQLTMVECSDAGIEDAGIVLAP